MSTHICDSSLGLGICRRDSLGANHTYIPSHIYSAGLEAFQ